VSVAFPAGAPAAFSAVLAFVTKTFDWFFTGAATLFVLFCGAIALGPWGRLRLGGEADRPEFGRWTWFAMLFSAGMGIGLVFFGVAEPMTHYASPPSGDGSTAEAARTAMDLTFFHWGIHAWAIYALLGLSIAVATYRRGLPLTIRSCFEPLLGRRIHGWAGHVIDNLAVLGTLFGLATSLGLGAMSVSAGLNHLWDLPHTVTTQLVLIALITAAATLSLVTGLHRGIRRLSELNGILAVCLLLFVLLAGPTAHVLGAFVRNLGDYAVVAVTRSLAAAWNTPEEASWIRGWTVFYWAWWISWAPFVGMFIARISRGRTVREFVIAVLIVPTLVTLLWFTVFGEAALWLEAQGSPIAEAVTADKATAVYVMLQELPLAGLTAVLAVVVVTVFFVTSSDSASFVVDMLTSGGHPDPPRWQRVFWAVAEGACAMVLLWAGGKQVLEGLQAAVVSIGLPFCALMLLMMVALWKALRAPPAALPEDPP